MKVDHQLGKMHVYLVSTSVISRCPPDWLKCRHIPCGGILAKVSREVGKLRFYARIGDKRSGVEVADVQAVLAGDLDPFLIG